MIIFDLGIILYIWIRAFIVEYTRVYLTSYHRSYEHIFLLLFILSSFICFYGRYDYFTYINQAQAP